MNEMFVKNIEKHEYSKKKKNLTKKRIPKYSNTTVPN